MVGFLLLISASVLVVAQEVREAPGWILDSEGDTIITFVPFRNPFLMEV